LLRSRFQVAARRLGYNQDREPLERGLFRPGAAFGQESLF